MEMEVKGASQGGQGFVTSNSSSQNIDTSVQAKNSISSNPKVSQSSEVKEKVIDERAVTEAVEKLNKLLEGRETHVEYERIGKAKHMAIKIVNTQTKEVIQELPPRKIVEMIDKLCELAGIMVDERA